MDNRGRLDGGGSWDGTWKGPYDDRSVSDGIKQYRDEHTNFRGDTKRELDFLDVVKEIQREEGFQDTSNRVIRVSARANSINWSELRKHYVLGKRKQLEDGTWVSEDYTYKELASKFSTPVLQVKYETVKKVGGQQGWGKLRKAYLARVNQINIGQELGLYTQENCQAQVAAINACNKLGTVLDRYIEHKYGALLESSEVITEDGLGEVDEGISKLMNETNKNTGLPIFLTEIKEAMKITSDIYKLQKQIYDDAPATEVEVIETMTNKPKFRNEKERLAKIAQLEARLGKSLTQVRAEKEEFEQKKALEKDKAFDRRVKYREDRGLPLDDLYEPESYTIDAKFTTEKDT